MQLWDSRKRMRGSVRYAKSSLREKVDAPTVYKLKLILNEEIVSSECLSFFWKYCIYCNNNRIKLFQNKNIIRQLSSTISSEKIKF
jgi:hypothetical protein